MLKKTVLFLLLAGATSAWGATKSTSYYVTITNMTPNQTLSPPLLAIHSPGLVVWTPGQPASEGVARIAEDGDTKPLAMALKESGKVDSLYAAKNPIMPGKAVRYMLTANTDFSVLSIVTMLVTTNDGFTGINGMPLPWGSSKSLVPAWDAGSEANTESCEHIPGPPCGSHNVRVTEGAEGAIYLHPGILGKGALSAERFSWSNPVAKITVERL